MTEYPEIQFVDTDTETIITELVNKYEEITERTIYPASPEKLFIAWIAAVIAQQRVLINETAKMNVPRYAKGDYLDSLAELFKDTARLPASQAITTVRCHISEAQAGSVFVPAGTRVTVDGDIMFATTDLLEIPAGQLYGDVEAKCLTAGEDGNGYAPGQIKEIVDVYDYYESIENITTSSGGADEESDADYYERMRESMESFSTAGPVNAYIYWTKSVSSAVSDVAVTSPSACVVDIRVLLQDGQEATAAILEEIEEALNADDIRPLTDHVTVSTPDPVSFSVDVTFYIGQPNENSATIIDTAVRQAVEDYIKWQTEKMGRDINPSYLIQMMMEAGAKRVEVRQPTFKTVGDIEVGKLSTKTVINGGMEDV